MPYRKELITKDNYYHIFNRGVNREKIFFEDRNYDFLLKNIVINFKDVAEIITYCFMPNHFHFVVKISDDIKFTKAIQKTFISYTKAVNKSYGRTGPLFEGRYKIKLIPDNNYLLHLSRYIHFNPVKANLVEKTEEWIRSSNLEYIGKRKNNFINTNIILDQVRDYKDFVDSFQEGNNYYLKDMIFDEE